MRRASSRYASSARSEELYLYLEREQKSISRCIVHFFYPPARAVVMEVLRSLQLPRLNVSLESDDLGRATRLLYYAVGFYVGINTKSA